MAEPPIEEVFGYVFLGLGNGSTNILKPLIDLAEVVVDESSQEELVGVGVVHIISLVKLLQCQKNHLQSFYFVLNKGIHLHPLKFGRRKGRESRSGRGRVQACWVATSELY